MKESEKERLDRFCAMTDDDIDYSDIPPLDDEFFKNAILVAPHQGVEITIHLDGDILNHFFKDGPGFKDRIRAVLKAHVEAQNGASPTSA